VKSQLSERKRILLDFLAYSPTDGGFTTVLENLLVCALNLNEFDFGIVYNRHYREVFANLPFEKIEVRTPKQKLRYVTSLIFVPWVLKKHRFDSLHAETSLISPLVKIPTSMMVHDLYSLINPAVGRGGIIRRTVDRIRDYFYVRSINTATVVGVISNCTKHDVERLTQRTAGITLIPHAIEFPKPQPPKRAWPEGSEPLRLLCVGSVVPRKNLELLLEALPKFNRPWQLEIVGNLWHWQKLRSGAERLLDPRVRVRGFVDQAELERLYDTSHLLILPSLYEGFGLPAAEAITHRCLALTSSGSAFDEYIPEECRFDPHDSDQLASIVNGMNAELYDRLLAESECSVRLYTRARQIEGYRSAFTTCVATNNQPLKESVRDVVA